MNNTPRKWHSLLTESIKMLKEQQYSPVPPTTAPIAPETNASATMLPQPSGTPAAPIQPNGVGQPKPFDVDQMIDRLNVIRGGKSFSDPEVYGQLTTYFNGLADTDKAVIDQFLQNLNKIVIQVSPDQQSTGTAPQVQPPMSQPSPGGGGMAAPAPAPSVGMPMTEENEVVDEKEDSEVLTESLKQGTKFVLGNNSLELGSPNHIKILKGILKGF